MGLIALEHNWRKQLKQDHVHAKMLAKALQAENELISVTMPETNIINFSFPEAAPTLEIHNSLIKQGVLGLHKGCYQRLVTHVGLSRQDIEQAITILNTTFKKYLT